MIYVLTKDYRQFQNFMQQFHLREDFASQGCIPESACIRGSCRRGQVRYLGFPAAELLRGNRNTLVLTWGTWFERPDANEAEALCKAYDIPMVAVPDLPRARAMREHPERFRRW